MESSTKYGNSNVVTAVCTRTIVDKSSVAQTAETRFTDGCQRMRQTRKTHRNERVPNILYSFNDASFTGNPTLIFCTNYFAEYVLPGNAGKLRVNF